MREPDFQVLRMSSRQLIAPPTWGANDQRNGALSTKHRIDFRGVIDNLIHRQDDEIDRHDLHNRAQPQHGGPRGHADKAIFYNRRVHHSLGAELLEQPGCDFIRALEDRNLLTEEEHVFIAQQFIAQAVMEGLPIGDLSHA